VQGHLLLHDKSIYMAGGNQPTVASYAVADGKFTAKGSGRGKDLYVRGGQVRASGFPLLWRPEDDHFVSPMEVETAAGVLALDTAKLALRPAASGPKAKPTWNSTPFQEIAAVVITKNAVLVSGLDRPVKKDPTQTESGVCALSLADGKLLWKQ